jgi:hypothetical protein
MSATGHTSIAPFESALFQRLPLRFDCGRGTRIRAGRSACKPPRRDGPIYDAPSGGSRMTHRQGFHQAIVRPSFDDAPAANMDRWV